MKHRVYSLYDSKTESYKKPEFVIHQGEIIRGLADAVNETVRREDGTVVPANTLGKFTTDYDLFYLGEYDDSSGKFVLLDAPKHVTTMLALKNNET